MDCPSGPNIELMLFALVFVKRACDLPSLSVKYSSMLPLRSLWNTTELLSGERLGRESVELLFERSIGFIPSFPSIPSNRNTSKSPVRNVWNMIQFGQLSVTGGAAFTSVIGGVGPWGGGVGFPGGGVGFPGGVGII